MNTLDTVFLIIVAVSISLFFVLLSGLTIFAWLSYRRIVRKAELALSTLGNATHILKEVGAGTSALSIYKVLKFIIRLSRKV